MWLRTCSFSEFFLHEAKSIEETRMHSSRTRTTCSLAYCEGGSPCQGVPAQGDLLVRRCLPGGVPCDLSHHAFDVTCMLLPHQLRPTNSAAAYILLVGHVTCKACWDTTTSPPPCCGQNSWYMLLKTLPCPKLRLRAVIIELVAQFVMKFISWYLAWQTWSCCDW